MSKGKESKSEPMSTEEKNALVKKIGPVKNVENDSAEAMTEEQKEATIKKINQKMAGRIDAEGKLDEIKQTPVDDPNGALKTAMKTKVFNAQENENTNSERTSQSKPSEKDVNESMTIILERMEDSILIVRKLRERIDFSAKAMFYSGLKNVIDKSEIINPVSESYSLLLQAKGSLGEALKYMIPNAELIGLKCYNEYLKICKEYDEKPTYPDTYPYLPSEYMNGLINQIKRLLNSDEKQDAEKNHDDWCKARIADGWVFGEVKNAENKTHPSLIPYHQLPLPERVKNESFLKIIEQYKNPYSYPKQKKSDVEPTADASFEISADLNIAIPEKRYFDKSGVELKFAYQLNETQVTDWIKWTISTIISELTQSIPSIFPLAGEMLHNNKVKSADLLSKNINSAYSQLVAAKNIFGYTFQKIK